MEYNVNSFCVFYMIEGENKLEPLSAFKYTAMPTLPVKGTEFRIIRNNKAMTFKVIEYLGNAYSVGPDNHCMQSFTYVVGAIEL